MVHMFIYSLSPHFFGWAIQHLSMLKTYGNEDKYFSLSLHSSLVLQPFNLSSIGKRVGRRARGGEVFISESSSTPQLHDMFPLEGTLMIPSPNGICLRSIRAPHYDDVSTGIMSDRISSAPVGQGCRQDGNVRQVESHHRHDFVCDQMRNEAWNKCRLLMLVVFMSKTYRHAVDTTEHFGAAGETHRAIFCLVNLCFGFNGRLSIHASASLCQPFVAFSYGALLWKELTARAPHCLQSQNL